MEVSHGEILAKLKTKIIGGKDLTMQSPLGPLQVFSVSRVAKEVFGFEIGTRHGIRDMADIVYRIEDILKQDSNPEMINFTQAVKTEVKDTYYKSLEGKGVFCIKPLDLSNKTLLSKHKIYLVKNFDGHRFETVDDFGQPIFANAWRFLCHEKYKDYLKKNPLNIADQEMVIDNLASLFKISLIKE